MREKTKNLLLIIAVIALLTFAIFVNKGSDFAGADDQAQAVITEVDPAYRPWFSPIWEPPSGEVESLLFALQASIGTGFICFYFGYRFGQKKKTCEVQGDGN